MGTLKGMRANLIQKLEQIDDIHTLRCLTYLVDHSNETHIRKMSYEELLILSKAFKADKE